MPLRDLASHAPALLFTARPDGQVDFVNERWAALVGVPADELLERGWANYAHPDDYDLFSATWADRLRTGEPMQLQWRLRRYDGSYRWIETRAECERDDDGAIVCWYGAGTDVDTQHRAMDGLAFLAQSGSALTSADDVDVMLTRLAQAALVGLADVTFFDLEEAGQYRRLVVTSPEISQEAYDALTAFTASSRGDRHPIAESMARRRALFVPTVDEAFIHEHIEDELRAAAWRVVGVRSIVATPLQTPTRVVGALTMLRTTNYTPFDQADLRVIEEIGLRAALAIENARLNASALIEASRRERQFHLIADSIPQLMWTASDTGACDWFNGKWFSYTGQALTDPLEDGWRQVHHEEDIGPYLAAWRASLRSGADFEMESRLRGADNAYRWFLTRAVALRDADGTVVKWYGTSTDIDDSRRAARDTRVYADVGNAISGSLVVQDVLEKVLASVCPAYTDWAIVTIADEQKALRIAATVHRDPVMGERLQALIGLIYADGSQSIGSPAAVRIGEPLLYERATYEDAARVVHPDIFPIVWEIGFQSVLVIPFGDDATARGTLGLCMSPGGRHFDPLDLPFYREFGRRVAPSIASAYLYERERRVAESFQRGALPARLPDVPGFEFSAIYEAGRAEALVGGDWYDAFQLIDGRIVVSIGDVAGSGLAAAITMANVRQAIRGVAQVHADPALMLEAADRTLRSEAPNRFVTAFVGVIEPLGGTITYRSAGHPPPIVLHADRSIELLQNRGLPLGLYEREERDSPFVTLETGSTLVLYTDGLIESTHEIIEGQRRLDVAVQSDAIMSSPDPAKELHDSVLVEGSRDDVAILVVRVGERPSALTWSIEVLDAQVAEQTRRSLVAALLTRNYSPAHVNVAELIFAELVGNLVRYAPGPAEIVLEWVGRRPVLHVRDRGPGFAFAPRLPPDIYSESGRGLFLIGALAEDFSVTLRPGGGSHARVVLRT